MEAMNLLKVGNIINDQDEEELFQKKLNEMGSMKQKGKKKKDLTTMVMTKLLVKNLKIDPRKQEVLDI